MGMYENVAAEYPGTVRWSARLFSTLSSQFYNWGWASYNDSSDVPTLQVSFN